jgi:hypothetical protein
MAEKMPIPFLLPCEMNFLKIYRIMDFDRRFWHDIVC